MKVVRCFGLAGATVAVGVVALEPGRGAPRDVSTHWLARRARGEADKPKTARYSPAGTGA